MSKKLNAHSIQGTSSFIVLHKGEPYSHKGKLVFGSVASIQETMLLTKHSVAFDSDALKEALEADLPSLPDGVEFSVNSNHSILLMDNKVDNEKVYYQRASMKTDKVLTFTTSSNSPAFNDEDFCAVDANFFVEHFGDDFDVLDFIEGEYTAKAPNASLYRNLSSHVDGSHHGNKQVMSMYKKHKIISMCKAYIDMGGNLVVSDQELVSHITILKGLLSEDAKAFCNILFYTKKHVPMFISYNHIVKNPIIE